LFQQLLQENPIPLNQAVKGMKFSPAVETVVMKGLARDRGQRYRTVEEFTSAFCSAAREEKKKGGFLSSIFGKG
jgi:hypothetical protein